MATWSVPNEPAVALKFALVEPEGTVTDAGTLSDGRLLESEMVTPPAPAAFDSVAVQVEIAPDGRLLGTHDTELSAALVTLQVPDRMALIMMSISVRVHFPSPSTSPVVHGDNPRTWSKAILTSSTSVVPFALT